MTRFAKLALADATAMLALFACWTVASDSSGDTSIALGFAFMVGFIFLATPLLALVLVMAFTIVRDAGLAGARGVLLYTGLSLAAHLALAYDSGFFDKWIDEYKRDARAREFPALTQLQYAVSRGPVSDIARVQAALAAGADPNAGSYSDPDTPLLVIAAARADAPTIEALLAAGANPDARAAMTYDAIETPAPLDLVLFSEYGNPIQSMELLLAAGADPAGTMLRSGACFRGDPALYRSAAGLGATDRTDGHQNTCLHLAAAQDRIALLEALLITPGSARPVVTQMLSSANHSSQYPLDTAVAAGNFGAALLLAQAGGEANQPWTLEKVMAADSGGEALANLRSLLLQRQKQAN